MNFSFRFISFLRFLGRHKAYTTIEIFGLSISLMFVILIIVYAKQELTTDRFHDNADRIYLLGNENEKLSAYGIGERVKERYPEIEDISNVFNCMLLGNESMAIETEGELKRAKVQFVNENFFRFFSFPLVHGSKNDVLADPNGAVISESFARNAFGLEDPIGKTLKIDSLSVTVNGVMKNIANSAIKYCDVLVRIENLRHFAYYYDGNTFDSATNTSIYLLEKENASLAAKAEDMRDYFKNLYWYYEEGAVNKVEFIPIVKAYYDLRDDNGTNNKGDKKLVIILLTVSFLILLFAVINYINLTVAQTGFRAKEMATLNLLGSSRRDLISRLITESTLLTFISFMIGLFLAFLFLPHANQLLNTVIDLPGLLTPLNIIIMLLAILLIGFISGLLPAILISQTKAVDVVKGTFRKQTKMIFSKFFITFQNTITIALMAAALVMITQINHMINAPLGYSTTNIIDIPVDDLRSTQYARILAKEIRQLSSAGKVSLSSATPFLAGLNHVISFEGRSITFPTLMVDSAFMDILGIEVIRENNVTSDNAYYLSEYALKEENLSIDAPTFHFYNPETPIAGVFKDFQLENVLIEKKPVLIQVKKEVDVHPVHLLVQAKGDPFNAYKDIKQIYEKTTRLDFPGKFMDQQVAESFAVQQRTSQIVGIFSAIAILLSLLGLLAMSTYFIQQRSREIGLRKVFGSSNRQILSQLVGTFLKYVFIAFIIATPIIWYLMRSWLSGYSYRIHLSPAFFILAGLGCLLLSFITVFWQSYLAANSNPAHSIKTE